MAGKKSHKAGIDGTDTANSVTNFMAQLNHPRKDEIETLRTIILGADSRIAESIKWNAPSFFTSEHFATFRLQPHNMVQIVFHIGAKVKSNSSEIHIDAPAGLLTWITKDRCTITFTDMDDVKAKATVLEDVVRQWISQI